MKKHIGNFLWLFALAITTVIGIFFKYIGIFLIIVIISIEIAYKQNKRKIRYYKQLRDKISGQPYPFTFKTWFWAKFTALVIRIFYDGKVSVEQTKWVID